MATMGYKPLKKIFDMSFSSYPGLEIKCTATSMGTLLEMAQMRVKLNEVDEQKKMAVFDTFVENIMSWNMEHPGWGDLTGDSSAEERRRSPECPRCGLKEDAPMPATVASLLCLDLDFIMDIIYGWMSAISSVSGPKGMSTSDGENQVEAMMNALGKLQNQ